MAAEPATNSATPGAAAATEAANASAAKVELAPQVEEPKKEDHDLSPRFAALAKRERQILAKQQELARMKSEAEAAHKEALEYKKIRENAKLNPMAYLESVGLSIQEVSEFILNDRKLTPEQRVDLLEKKLQQDAEAQTRAAQEAAERETQAVIDQHKKSVAQFVTSDPDTYELINKHGEDGTDLVFQVIYDHFVENGGRLPPMPIQDAARAVEDHLERLYKESILTSKKFQPKEQPAALEAKEPGPATPSQPKTLTHQALTSAPPPTSGYLSDDESKRRAAALLKWT